MRTCSLIILDLPFGSSASEALNKLKWKTLARRRAEHRATFIYKCLNNLFSHRFNIEFNKDKHDYNTRCKNNIRESAFSRNWGHWSSTNFASNDWNKLDLSIRQSPSLASFKRALRNVNSLKSNFYIFIYIYVIYRAGGPYGKKLCPRSWVRPEAVGRGPYSRPRAQFFPIRTDLVR